MYFTQRDIDEVAGLITVAIAAAVAARRATVNPQVRKALDLMIEPFKDMMSPTLYAKITEVNEV